MLLSEELDIKVSDFGKCISILITLGLSIWKEDKDKKSKDTTFYKVSFFLH